MWYLISLMNNCYKTSIIFKTNTLMQPFVMKLLLNLTMFLTLLDQNKFLHWPMRIILFFFLITNILFMFLHSQLSKPNIKPINGDIFSSITKEGYVTYASLDIYEYQQSQNGESSL